MASVNVSVSRASVFTKSDSQAHPPVIPYDVTEAGRKSTVAEVHAISPNGVPKQSRKIEFQLEEHPVDQVQDIKVGIIGAGLAGISAGILLPAKLPGLDLRIYEKNTDVVFLPY